MLMAKMLKNNSASKTFIGIAEPLENSETPSNEPDKLETRIKTVSSITLNPNKK